MRERGRISFLERPIQLWRLGNEKICTVKRVIKDIVADRGQEWRNRTVRILG